MTITARNWETQLREWAKPPDQAEQTKMEATELQIRAAIASSTALSARNIQVAAQGSYKNRTHVPRESDVDIRVVCNDIFWPDYSRVGALVRPNLEKKLNLSDSAYTYEQFRTDVGQALVARFGPPPNVVPGDKAWGIRESRYRVEADVVAVLPLRRYNADGSYDEGVQFVTRKGKKIVNWPEQQHRNGVEKNQATHERFKAMVRVVKNLRNEMDDKGEAAAAPIPSFLIECMVWNVPDSTFGHTSYWDELKEVLRHIYLKTKPDGGSIDWAEESGLKWLFRNQPWTSEQANVFVLAAWRYVGFKN